MAVCTNILSVHIIWPTILGVYTKQIFSLAERCVIKITVMANGYWAFSIKSDMLLLLGGMNSLCPSASPELGPFVFPS